MNIQLKAQTPKGTFGVFTNQLQSGEYAAAVVYQSTGRVESHVEKGDTEEQALGRLRDWCEKIFGQPCEVS